jgi:ABC-2 type transport system permease protein
VDSAVRFRLPLTNLAAVCLQMGLVCCLLALAAQAIAGATGRRTVGIAVTTGYTTVSYVLYGLSATVHPLTYLKPLTPWRWYLANDPLRTGVGYTEVIVLLVACAVMVIAGAILFRARDLHA